MTGKGPLYWIVEIGACVIIVVVVLLTLLITLDAILTWFDARLTSRKLRRQAAAPVQLAAVPMSSRASEPTSHV